MVEFKIQTNYGAAINLHRHPRDRCHQKTLLTVHDLHANILFLLGINHTRLTRRFGGRDVRLTDVYGRVLDEIMI